MASLADPLGDYIPEIEHCLAVITAVAGWLDHRCRSVGDHHRGAKGRYTEHARYGALIPAVSLAAFKAERADVFNT